MPTFKPVTKIRPITLLLIVACLVLPATGAAQDPAASIEKLQADLRSDDGLTRMQAITELGYYGPLAAPAVPELTRLLDEGKLAVRHEAALTLGRIGPDAASAVPTLLKLLDEESLILKDGALRALQGIGAAAKDAIPKLTSLLDSSDDYVRVAAARTLLAVQKEVPQDQRQRILDTLATGIQSEAPAVAARAAEGLAAIGSDAVPILVDVLQKAPARAAPAAVDALIRIGAPAEKAVLELVRLSRAEDETVRLAAVTGLGGIGVLPDVSVPALIPRLADESPAVRAAAANALSRFGPAAETALDDLRRRLGDENESVRMAAARAIGSMGAAGRTAVDDLLNAINTDTGPVALAAADALAGIGKPAVPALAEAAKKPELRGLALAVLERIGPDAEAAVPVLGRLIVGLDEDNASQAALTIGAIGPAAKEISPVLISLMKTSKSDRVRAASAYALGKIGAKDALPVLQDALKADDPLLSLGAAHAVAAVAPDDEDAIAAALPRLMEGLDNERPGVRAGVAQVLGGLGPKAAEAVEPLRALLDDANASVRSEAAGALGRIGAKDPETIAALTKSLTDPNPLVRYASLFALGNSGKAAAEVQPAIQQKLESGDAFEAAVAAWALVKIAPESADVEAATPKLMSILGHPSPAVRMEAAKTLAEIGGDDPEIVSALQTALKEESVPEVKQAIEAAIASAKNGSN